MYWCRAGQGAPVVVAVDVVVVDTVAAAVDVVAAVVDIVATGVDAVVADAEALRGDHGEPLGPVVDDAVPKKHCSPRQS